MGLQVNIEKTKTMSSGEQEDFFIDGQVLGRVDRFKYLGSWVTDDCKLDVKITARIQASGGATGGGLGELVPPNPKNWQKLSKRNGIK